MKTGLPLLIALSIPYRILTPSRLTGAKLLRITLSIPYRILTQTALNTIPNPVFAFNSLSDSHNLIAPDPSKHVLTNFQFPIGFSLVRSPAGALGEMITFQFPIGFSLSIRMCILQIAI